LEALEDSALEDNVEFVEHSYFKTENEEEDEEVPEEIAESAIDNPDTIETIKIEIDEDILIDEVPMFSTKSLKEVRKMN
jgi:hypothetical protein